MSFENLVEEVHVLGGDLVNKVRELIHEGNVQRIVVKDEHGNTFVEIPVTVAAAGAILAPLLAASRGQQGPRMDGRERDGDWRCVREYQAGQVEIQREDRWNLRPGQRPRQEDAA